MTLNRDEVKTREELRKVREHEKATLSLRERRKKIRIRLIPVWLKVLLVFLMVFVSVSAGLVVGYGVIGNGKPQEALDLETWTHIIDLVKGN